MFQEVEYTRFADLSYRFETPSDRRTTLESTHPFPRLRGHTGRSSRVIRHGHRPSSPNT